MNLQRVLHWHNLLSVAVLIAVIAVIAGGIWLTCTQFTSRYGGGRFFHPLDDGELPVLGIVWYTNR